jgi:lipid II:glycine glycyltransferase (peptidoglycan interpeptide bridge formation enzyme)
MCELILFISQVRVQSKKIASQVIEKAKQLKKCEEHKRKALKEKDLCDWKQEKLKDLQSELDHGLETYGESHRAVQGEVIVNIVSSFIRKKANIMW